MLVKALPHVGGLHGETVCCAGITESLEWRRQFPIKFRELEDERFRRWDWIEYDWRKPGAQDPRPESRRVQEGTIKVTGHLKNPKERSELLNRLLVGSISEAEENGKTLALIKPITPIFSWKKKTQAQIDKETVAYAQAVSQLSFFGSEREALSPCPYEFRYNYQTSDGRPHSHKCGDWETSATYFRRENALGSEAALNSMKQTFGKDYPTKGMAFVMGTHSKYPDTWLLVGILRIDPLDQLELSI